MTEITESVVDWTDGDFLDLEDTDLGALGSSYE